MKVLIATGLYPPEIGGPATYTLMLERHLPQYGFELAVVPFARVRKYPKIIRHIAYLWHILKTGKGCSLYIALDPVSVGLPVLIAHMITGKPYLLRVAGDYAWEQGQQRYGITETLDEFASRVHVPLAVKFLSWLQTTAALHAKRIVVPSEYMKRIVTGWGVSSKKIVRIYSALEPLATQSKHATEGNKERPTEVVITTAARFVPWKGIGTLIDLLPSLREKLGNVVLVAIGDGPLLETLKKQAGQLNVGAYVRFPGRLGKSELGQAVLQSDVFILNTSYEGMSHQLLEVMDLGVPVIATRVGGNPELIEDGETGLLVPYNDRDAIVQAACSLVENQELRERIITQAKERTAVFNQVIVMQEIVRLLRSEFTS